MPDPITLTAAGIGAVALKEGIKFLYEQAGEILRRWRERKDESRDGSAMSSGHDNLTLTSPPPGVFDGQISQLRIHFVALNDKEAELRRLYRELSEYVTEVEPIMAGDRDLLSKVDNLRGILEEVFGQHITFVGEQRPATGTSVVGTVKATTVSGEAIGIDAEGPVAGDLHGSVEAGTVDKGGKAVGVKIRR
jgi:hypothetical protein